MQNTIIYFAYNGQQLLWQQRSERETDNIV